MDVTYTFHLAGVHHREAAERLTDLIYGKLNMAYQLRCSLVEAGKAYESNPAPVRPRARHNDKEMDSALFTFHKVGDLDRFIQIACDEYADVSAIWWRVEDVSDTEYNLQCWFYTAANDRIDTESSTIRCKPELFDESLHLHLNEMLAKVAGAYRARFDANRNIILLSTPPREIPQCEWADPRINPVFRDIIQDFIPR